MVISDLDGTLLGSDGKISEKNLWYLDQLGQSHVTRVVATGRSLYSAKLVLSESTPIDYLIFSSGAGIVKWANQELVSKTSLPADITGRVVEWLKQNQLDFMLHMPVPENHLFHYHSVQNEMENPDFFARMQRYAEFATPLREEAQMTSSQFVIIQPQQPRISVGEIRRVFPDLSVIRTTSPLDLASLWIEIFPRTVNKGLASAWLIDRLGVDWDQTIAVGNDYNDIELLEWAHRSYVVANAPQKLQQTYEVVRPFDKDGFSQVAEKLLRCKLGY